LQLGEYDEFCPVCGFDRDWQGHGEDCDCEACDEDPLAVEIAKLRKALAGVIPWVGFPAEGPSWATPDAKARNKAMCEKALQEACACFPDDYNGFREQLNAN
jgi:hypothetical protein